MSHILSLMYVFHISVSNYTWLALFPGGEGTRLIIDGDDNSLLTVLMHG